MQAKISLDITVAKIQYTLIRFGKFEEITVLMENKIENEFNPRPRVQKTSIPQGPSMPQVYPNLSQVYPKCAPSVPQVYPK